eukprot:TRINITY_DN73427_c0_g1_i1.p1 TRINITY_DN73427_c0_g1~~TRINITY_DN73427_c0_g1_i1.p1  ORF type:complete len:160 (+),score=28.45 TRINITY_DN73427_c0_g1_i1:75-482(+)
MGKQSNSKGDGSGGRWVNQVNPLAVQMMGFLGAMGAFQGKGKGWGKGGGGRSQKPDPPGSGRVFVRGFDFGTTDEQFNSHMGQAGKILSVQWVTRGSACVIYEDKAMAKMACQMLNNTTIPGNSRYIDVLEKESE